MPAIVDDVRTLRRRLNELGVRTITDRPFDAAPYCKIREGGPNSGALGCPTCERVDEKGAKTYLTCPPREE